MSAPVASKTSLDREAARKLIDELQGHQAREIECLRKLYGLLDEDIGDRAKDDIDSHVIESQDLDAGDKGLTPTTGPTPTYFDPTFDCNPLEDSASLERHMNKIKGYLGEEHDRTSEWILEHTLSPGRGGFNHYNGFYTLNGSSGKTAFCTTDSSQGVITKDAALSGGLERLLITSLQNDDPCRGPRGREIEIYEFIPSSLAVLLVVDLIRPFGRDQDYDSRYVCQVLKKHLNGVGASPEVDIKRSVIQIGNPNPDSFMNAKKVFSFRLPFFEVFENSLEDTMSKAAPLVEPRTFGGWLDRNKIIRQRQFSIVFFANRRFHDPLRSFEGAFESKLTDWKLISLTPVVKRPWSNEEGFQLALWVVRNLQEIARKFQTVLTELDRQMSIDSTTIFKDEERNKLLFDDENFSNSKKYFWALQSLRVFLGNVTHIRQALPQIFEGFECFAIEENMQQEDWQERALKDVTSEYEVLEKRIEQKRMEVEGLSNGLFSASSVIEARLAASQNKNIQLLTLVTIAFLPISFVTSIFSMSVLPGSATLGSFFATIVITTFVTFIIVFNLRNADRALYSTYEGLAKGIQNSMKDDPKEVWRKKGALLEQAEQLKRAETPISSWWYVGYLFHNPGFLLQKLRRREPKDENKDIETVCSK